MKNIKNQKGFTLIELVVVIAILGILAGIAIPRFMDATASARGARILADMRTIDSAAMLYQAKTGNLPGGSSDLLSNNGTSNGTSQYQLLASWPGAPTGKAIVTNNKNKQISLTSTSDRTYSYDATTGRAGLGTAKSVDAILNSESDLGI